MFKPIYEHELSYDLVQYLRRFQFQFKDNQMQSM